MYLFNYINKHFPEYINFFNSFSEIKKLEKELKNKKQLLIYTLELKYINGKIIGKIISE